MKFTIEDEIWLDHQLVECTIEVKNSINENDIKCFIQEYKNEILYVYRYGGQDALNNMVDHYIDVMNLDHDDHSEYDKYFNYDGYAECDYDELN